MIPELQRKLKQHIQGGLKTEADIVYMLVCVRKILEQDDAENEFSDLKFYCDWILHSKLSGRYAQKILNIFDSCIDILLSTDEEIQSAEIEKISKLSTLKGYIEKFLNRYVQAVWWHNNANAWPHFLSLYAAIIHDCPLIVRSNNPISRIQRIVVTLEWAERLCSGHKYYKINWAVVLKDGNQTGRSVCNSFEAEYAGPNP